MRNRGIDPQPVRRSHIRPQRRSVSSINKANDALTINGVRDRLPEAYISEPALLAGDCGILRQVGIQIEEQKVVFQPWAQVKEPKTTLLLLLFKNGIVFCAYPAQNVCVAGLEADDLRVITRDKEEDQFIQIGKALTFAIGFPVVGIALQNHPLSRHILLQPEWPQPDYLRRWTADPPDLREAPLLIRFFQNMLGQNGKTIKEPFSSPIRLA